jgi:aldehyde dehydrogenase (NAD+)
MRKEEMKKYQHFINGEYTDPDSGQWFDSENPYTGEVWAQIAKGNAADIDKAVGAAKAAFENGWGRSSPTYRGKLLNKLAELLERDAERLGKLEVQDNGKLLAEMGSQTRYIGEWYRYFGGLADKIEGTVIPTDKPNMFNFTRYEPFGVVGLITPWNSPLLLVAYKLAPALAAGNTAVIKPSEFTSASTVEMMALIKEAGFPDGVVNVVTGYGAEVGAPLVDHPDVEKIAFTGSDASGQKIYENGAKKLIPCNPGAWG